MDPNREKYIDTKHKLEKTQRALKKADEKIQAAKDFYLRLSMFSAGLAINDDTKRIAAHLDKELAALKKELDRT